MLRPFPATPRDLVWSACMFVTGLAFFSIGAHLSYVNVAPQQARTKARSDMVSEYIRRKSGN
ncbi:hypothetical protein QJS04_geneDACA019189 [Acorus gramineus]|uniref:Uncharacterized protein n=1 Tax=Acorus gramineus TaxID=55184 RepID=A0AAV9B956_ACOGR|nr:hypothetical protein QJS04_geneDACA019189 [Acorus gramineus]